MNKLQNKFKTAEKLEVFLNRLQNRYGNNEHGENNFTLNDLINNLNIVYDIIQFNDSLKDFNDVLDNYDRLINAYHSFFDNYDNFYTVSFKRWYADNNFMIKTLLR